MQKIYNVLYYILILILGQIISNIWLSYFIKNFYILQIVSFILTATITIFIFKKNKKKNLLLSLNKKEKETLEKLKYKLMYSSKLETLSFLKSIIDPELTINKTEIYLHDKKNNIIHIPKFINETLTKEDVIQVMQQHSQKSNNFYIYCINDTNNISDIFDNLLSVNIHIITINTFYMTHKEIIDDTSTNLNITKTKQKQKINLKEICRKITEPSKWKTYFFYGLTLFLLNRINSYKIYFTIFITMFWSLAIICLFRKISHRLSQ